MRCMQLQQFYSSKLEEFSLFNRGRGNSSPVNFSLGPELQHSMQIESGTLFTSDFFVINDLVCHCCEPSTKSVIDCNNNFNITFTREGYFTFNTYPGSIDAYTGNIFLKKPGCEYSVTQMTTSLFGCTIINFAESFLEALEERYSFKKISFFKDAGQFVLVLRSTPALSLLHHLICRHLAQPQPSKLYLDCMILEMAEHVIDVLLADDSIVPISPSHIKQQVFSIQRAQEYMAAHLCESISLQDLSRYCFISPFHFSRVFKKFTGYSPYHYLQIQRLKHAEILLKTTGLTITDIGFQSGFNSPDYFCAAFTKAYKMSPSMYKRVLAC